MFEYHVDAVDHGERGIAITITFWRILNLCVRIIGMNGTRNNLVSVGVGRDDCHQMNVL
jgi:hypothetical protein